MNYIFLKNPALQLDLMVDKKYEPQLVGYLKRMYCTYKEERESELDNGKTYVTLKDIQGRNGAAIGELIGLFFSLEWGMLIEGEPQSKFYILVNPRRKEKKKDVRENRKEAGAGGKGGD